MSKNVSNQFKNIIKNGGPFYAYAVMTLADGTEITLTSENDFTVSGSGYSEESDSGFPFGSALSKIIILNLDNTVTSEPLKDTQSENILDTQNNTIIVSGKSEKYDYYYARIVLYTEADLPDGTTERVREGIFTVIDSVTPGDVLEITAYDDMYKADVEFLSTLTYPVSAQMLLNEVCSKCDITLGSSTFKNNSFQIQQPPEGLTGRQVIGYIAQIAGGNAIIDRNGRLVIKTYDFSGFDAEEDVSAGEVETESGIHIISEYTTDPDIGTDDVTITGVSVTIESEDIDTEDEVYVVGSEEYAVSIDNPLISGKEKEAVDLIAESVIGITARPFSGDFFPDPTVEFMDLAYVVDRKDNVYKTFITSHDFSYLGSSTFSCGVESPERHGGSYYSTAADVYQKAKNDLKVNKSQWEQAMEQLSQQVANASGLYTTEEEQPDGSTIFYMHNKPTLEESDIVWEMTAETLTVSTDGGKTWNAGITVNGEVIARIMNTIGINFDWGVGGTLIVQDEDGNQTAYIDAETGTVRFAVESLTITGKTVQEIASEQSETAINDFVDAVYNPDITNLQAQIDGQIETWFYDYIPTTDNYPASEWTTDTERDKHLGDLFYVVDNTEHGGEAYRWAKINNVYTWDYVEDTAVTKALADAAAAQDTADQKRRVFVTTPTPPYDVGDLWVGNDTSDLMRCQRSRSSGNYDASDWIKAVKYTDDTELYNFVQNDYNTTIQEIYQSVDQKAETWYQDTDPALGWTENENTPLQDLVGENILDLSGDTIITIWEKEKSTHDGDLWKNPSNNVEYIYQDGIWIEMAIPDAVFDTIDGKAQIFVVQPTPPYNIGDTWFTGTTILVCNTRRDSGEFVQSDWAKNDNYTDDSALHDFIEGDYAETIEDIQTQTDQKAETWYQSTDPSLSWTADEKAGHAGDLWYNTEEQKTYIYNGSAWDETKSNPPDEVFDSIDGKAQIFVSTPAPPYSAGDLWFDSASSDIMTCVTARSSGSFNVGDWEKRNKYTDDSALNEFLSSEYQETIQELKDQADQKAETWYQSNDPAASWSAEEKENHAGDLWYNTGNQNTYIYNGASWQLTKTTPPDDVFDQIDGKAQIFISQPSPPYQEGDLWFNSATSDIMTCVNTRASGDYTASDWQKRNKYTDDSYAQQVNQELSEFISGYQDEIAEIQNSVDQKAETWYQTSDPASQWTDTEDIPLCDSSGNNILDTTGGTIVTIWESEKATHNGDLWHNPSNNNEYIYQDGYWNKTSIPDDVFDIIDGKAQIFVNTPTPPYAIGDLWFNSATSDIMTCINGKESGSYISSDWQKRNKYTDDSYAEEVARDLSDFTDQVVGDLENLQTQIDGKIETYYYDYQPTLTNIPASAWTTEEERQKHIGDLFYYKSTGFTYRFLKDGNVWKWQAIKDEDISKALSDAADAQDTADSKRRVFTSTPTPPYDVGDLWAQGGSGDIMRCIRSRSSGNYTSSDWDKASKYTDDSAVGDLDDSLDQQGIFNRLTNDGTVQGIYMEDGQIYLLFTYAKGGVLSLGGKNNGNGYAQILNEDDEVIAELDSNGIGILGQFQVSGENSYGKKSWSILAPSELFFYDSQRQVIGYLNAMIDNNGVAAANLTGNDAVTLNLRYNSNQVYKHYILADDNYRLYDQTVKRWHTFFGDERHNGDSYFSKIFLGSDDGNDCYLQYNNYYNSGAISSSGGFYAYGDLGCQGTKHRIVQTDDYQKRLLYSYETPSPYFGDLGCGETDNAGICVIVFDDIFLETVNTKCDYQVFLQKEGPGDIWVESKSFDHIVVRGTPNLKFSWEAKVKQKGYEYQRLEAFELSQDSVESIDYERQAEVMVEKYYKELEEMFV